jgi:hypothetical protein
MKSSFNKSIDFENNNIQNLNKICSCSKTKCIKKYCECLSNNQYCFNCNCIDCKNKPNLTKKNIRDEKEILNCTCTKSNCNKKYCECYKIGEKCNDNCRCINCLNNYEIDKKNEEKKKKIYHYFTMERISILIKNQNIFIDIQPIYFDELENYNFDNKEKKILCNKRNRFECLN